MKTFKQFIVEQQELLENRIEGIKSRFAKHAEHVDHYAEKADPTKKKIHTQWIMGQHAKGHVRPEDHGQIHQDLKDFEQHKNHLQHKDLNKYQHIADLRDDLAKVKGTDIRSKNQKDRDVKHAGAELVHEEPGLKVHRLKTKEAACHYGAGTKWCTAAKNNNMFDDYHKRGHIYVAHHGDGKKHQFHFESGQFADEQDRMHEPEHLAKKYPKLTNVKAFQHHIDFVKDKKKWCDDNLHHKDGHVRAVVAQHGSDKHRDHLMHDKDEDVRMSVVMHGSDKHLDHLMHDKEYQVRAWVATRPSAKHHDHLMHDENVDVRETVAGQGSDKHRDHLMHDKDSRVLYAVARYGSSKHHKYLMHHKDEYVRVMVAQHTTNHDVLRHIGNEMNTHAANAARNRLHMLE